MSKALNDLTTEQYERFLAFAEAWRDTNKAELDKLQLAYLESARADRGMNYALLASMALETIWTFIGPPGCKVRPAFMALLAARDAQWSRAMAEFLAAESYRETMLKDDSNV